jgi:6-phosphogluconolactonase
VDYQKHLQEDGAVVSGGNSNESLTPTFASVAVYLRDPRWHRMPFILVSGKQLDERTAYARIVFKQSQFHLGQRLSNESPCLPEIIFLIQGEQISSPGVLVSEQLSLTTFMYPTMESVTWTQESITYPRTAGSNSCKYVHIHPSQAVEANAYVSVIQAVLEGRQEYFVDTDSLLLSWEVWSPLLHQIELSNHSLHLSPYTPDMLDGLDFELSGASMRPKNDISTVVNATTCEAVPRSEMRVSVSSNVSTYWTELLGHKTIVADKYALSYSLAEDLLRAAQRSVEDRREFHLALPGGQSPLSLMNALSLDFYHLFPWQQTHIWQTDERCVKATSADSNWNQISKYLLSVVPIPFHNLHPLPVDLHNGVCNSADNGDLLYQKTLNGFIEDDGKLDHVVLGVGNDGHIASLFPEAGTLATSDTGDFVKITELKDSYDIKVKKRMSLSFDAISRARSIAVLVMGAGKETMMERVAQCLRLEGHCDVPLARLLSYISMDRLAVYVASEIL